MPRSQAIDHPRLGVYGAGADACGRSGGTCRGLAGVPQRPGTMNARPCPGPTHLRSRHRAHDLTCLVVEGQVDMAILRELQEDGHMSLVELGRRVGLTAAPVQRRVRRWNETDG